ncbi:hypothetical protein I312_102938 [Cryptococcus bacillisporus CA1280]|uniref:uncharacterized protein n=1 Tax=Cryptococcus bacillisporus CA1280 TaxID=1296109 RepID=UPI0033690E5A
MINISYYLLPLVHLQTLAASIRGAAVRLGFPNNLRRRQAAHENCFENEAIFIGAVIAGNHVGLSTKYMNIMSLSYFMLRCIYIWMYIKFTDQKKSYWRSIVYWASNFCFLTTFVKCGLKLNTGY